MSVAPEGALQIRIEHLRRRRKRTRVASKSSCGPGIEHAGPRTRAPAPRRSSPFRTTGRLRAREHNSNNGEGGSSNRAGGSRLASTRRHHPRYARLSPASGQVRESAQATNHMRDREPRPRRGRRRAPAGRRTFDAARQRNWPWRRAKARGDARSKWRRARCPRRPARRRSTVARAPRAASRGEQALSARCAGARRRRRSSGSRDSATPPRWEAERGTRARASMPEPATTAEQVERTAAEQRVHARGNARHVGEIAALPRQGRRVPRSRRGPHDAPARACRRSTAAACRSGRSPPNTSARFSCRAVHGTPVKWRVSTSRCRPMPAA